MVLIEAQDVHLEDTHTEWSGNIKSEVPLSTTITRVKSYVFL